MSRNSWAISRAEPATSWKTPAGNFAALLTHSANITAQMGVALAGFKMTLQPAASAGAILRTASTSGKFHGADRRNYAHGRFDDEMPLAVRFSCGTMRPIRAPRFLPQTSAGDRPSSRFHRCFAPTACRFPHCDGPGDFSSRRFFHFVGDFVQKSPARLARQRAPVLKMPRAHL